MKRLVVCCDGTWQGLSSDWPTNVLKMAQAVASADDKGVPQIVYYSAGVGAESENLVQKTVSGVSGEGLDIIIQDAYRFLVLNYDIGDEIYLFGFSRGAYTVRSLSGLLYCSGLVKRQFLRKVPDAYRLYRDRLLRPSDTETTDFRQRYSHLSDELGLDDPAQGRTNQPSVQLLACWDTVGALGIPDLIPILPFDNWLNHKYEFHDTQLNRRVKNALHALAIDELRGAFTPAPMQKSDGAATKICELWFVGDHSSIGGGNRQVNALSDISMQWMVDEITRQKLGLQLNTSQLPDALAPDFSIAFDNSPGRIYRLLPHQPRTIDAKSQIHLTVSNRWDGDAKYRPKNLQSAFGASLAPHVWQIPTV